MDSIKVPGRYFCPNPLDNITDIDIANPNGGLQYIMDCKAVEIENGKARWLKRYKNRFLQMYSVQVTKCKEGVQLDQICGKIIFDVFKIFQRKPGGNPYAINKNNGLLRLMGPMCPVDGWSDILIFPRLYRGNQAEDFYHPDNPGGYNKFLKMKGSWDCFDGVSDLDAVGIDGDTILDHDSNNPSDMLISEEIDTSIGKIQYSYAIFEDAIDSFLTVQLLEWYGAGPAPTVYGRIFASNTRLPDVKSTIFFLHRREAVSVCPLQYVPIQRPVNIVSAGHSLKLSVRLKDKRVGGSRKDDSTIASDTLSFEAQCVTYGRGEDGIIETQEFVGKLCKLQLKVYFLPSWSKAFYTVERDSDDDGGDDDDD